MLLVYNCVLLKTSTWYSKHVEESNNIGRINNIQCITLVVLYGQFMMHGQRNIKLKYKRNVEIRRELDNHCANQLLKKSGLFSFLGVVFLILSRNASRLIWQFPQFFWLILVSHVHLCIAKFLLCCSYVAVTIFLVEPSSLELWIVKLAWVWGGAVWRMMSLGLEVL